MGKETPPKGKKNYLNWAIGAALTIVSTIIGLRSTDMDPINILLIGGGLLWVWVAFKRSDFSVNKHRHFGIIWWIVVVVIAIGVSIGAWSARGKAETTNEEILAELRETLSKIETNEQQRLDRDYPLGYAMISFSGEKNVVLPRLDRFEVDWDSITVYKDNQNTMHMMLDRLYDKDTRLKFTDVVFRCPAIPGEKLTIINIASVTITIECLKAEPIGIFGVLGFAERTDRE